ncbi:ABC-2 transporter permease [Thalassoglobus polymorphus]|uniref:ABC-2 family transporter protein n=1 Tax=Thalassoglobus polymorphus TaxID=2527994 RepID=A0A517QQ24_9PLAN|nr:ABC transporter permease subunit [Thalassoglobus polymorphus]QDT33738.1 ABC-2 family transporter protein [Thalassoglobus polymorphus]
MSIEPPSFDVAAALLNWVIAIVACSIIGLAAGFAGSLAYRGTSGPRVFWNTLKRGFRDLTRLSLSRIGAIASLTIKEAISRKAFVIGLLFLLLFMFGGWFLSSSDAEKPALPYITFVMTIMYFLLNLMAILISCWGLPADIKAKSMHTVVTKPVRRSEIVIGRIVGYSGVVLSVLAVTSIFGYVWIQRQVPQQAKDQLIARVPAYGSLSFLTRTGQPSETGTNVGDIWEYRGYIEGLSKARAIWKFDNLDTAELRKRGEIRFEQKFEAFRTYKGDIEEQTRYQITLVNPTTKLRVPIEKSYPVAEHKQDPELSVVVIPGEIEYQESYEVGANAKVANLFDDLIDNGSLTVEVACIDDQQYIGCAEGDLFVRMEDRSFLSSYLKANIGLAFMLVLVVSIGTTSSCFVKGPVSTLLTGSMIIMGNVIYEFVNEAVKQQQERQDGKVIGGGMLESIYRLVTGMNQTSPLPDNLGIAKDIIERLDQTVFNILFVVRSVIPDFTFFSMNKYTANGYDVPWTGALLPSILITLGFLFPLIILGYFSLQLRELEHK